MNRRIARRTLMTTSNARTLRANRRFMRVCQFRLPGIFWQRPNQLLSSASVQLPMKLDRFLLFGVLSFFWVAFGFAAQSNDTEFSAVAEEFIKGYLNARPLLGTQLGLHEYDGRGSADFLRKEMVNAIGALKDQELRASFIVANRKAALALTDFATWLEKERLPKATPDFALGEAKYQRWLIETELVDLPPAKILEIGLSKLKAEQEVFANAAKTIDSNRSAIEVFKEIQRDHPPADKLIADVA